MNASYFVVGDLEAREEQGRTVSAVNPMHHEQEADLEDMEQVIDEEKFINPAYEGILVSQFVFEETELQANGGYSRLSSRMGSAQRKPQFCFAETSTLTPHYSLLDLNNGSEATDSVDQRLAQDPKNHQYEDVDQHGEVKIANDGISCEHREHTTNNLYEDVSIGKPPMQNVNDDYTESCSYVEVGEIKQLQVEVEAEKNNSKFENQESDIGAVPRKEWNGIRNYSDDLELNQGTDNGESNMLDSKIEGTFV